MIKEVSKSLYVPTVLWARAWRRPNGEVHSTVAYLSREELMKNEPEDSVAHGNQWCGEPFSYKPDVFEVRDFKK